MVTKNVSKIIFVLCVLLYGKTIAQTNENIYIRANILKTINLDENFCSKTVTKDKIVFSFGLETLGEINNFVFNKKDIRKQINKDKLNVLNFSEISQLNRILRKKNLFKKPNKAFENIYIIETTNKNIYIYIYIYIFC